MINTNTCGDQRPRMHKQRTAKRKFTCLQLVETQTYQDICTSHFPASRCINNPAASGPTLFYDNKMNERTDAYACANGYCTCSASSA